METLTVRQTLEQLLIVEEFPTLLFGLEKRAFDDAPVDDLTIVE